MKTHKLGAGHFVEFILTGEYNHHLKRVTPITIIVKIFSLKIEKLKKKTNVNKSGGGSIYNDIKKNYGNFKNYNNYLTLKLSTGGCWF